MSMTNEPAHASQSRMAGRSALTALTMRLVPSLAAALVYAAYMVLYHFAHPLYLPVIEWFDSTPGTVPFGDLGATLSAINCWHQGANVLVANACMHGGSFNYSPLLLHVPLFGLGPQNLMPAGVASGLLFIIACAFLPPPRSVAGLGLRCLALCSCAVTHALETGNIDALIFVLCVGGLLLVQAGGIAALAGYAVFLAGGAIKFYPVALLALVVRERRPVFITITAFIAVLGVVFLLKYRSDLAILLTSLPAGLPFAGVFGAMNVPFGFALLAFLPRLTLSPNVPEFFSAVGHPFAAQYIVLCTRALVIAGIIASCQLAPRYRPLVGRLAPEVLPFLIGGAAVVIFCFDLTGNFEYRGVFLLLPFAALGSGAPDGPDKAMARRLRLVILFLLWERPIRKLVQTLAVAILGVKHAVYPEIAFWLVKEYCWWWLVVRFSAIIIGFISARLPALLFAGPIRQA